MRNLDELIDAIKNDDYKVKMEYPKRPEGYKKENYVYDENQTVKWNREHQEILSKKYQQDLKDFHGETSNKEINFKNDFINSIVNEYKLSDKTANLIYNKSWDQGHAEGLLSVVYEAKDLLDFVVEIIKSENIK